MPLLGPGDPSPVLIENPDGRSPILLVGDHAGRAVPHSLNGLGVAPEVLDKHIAQDIGIAGLGPRLARLIDAPFIHQTYSRLVIDCNRQLHDKELSPAVSDRIDIPGNQHLTPEGRAARIKEIWRPYHDTIARVLDGRRETLFVSLHSFTPVLADFIRPWRYGVLHSADSPLSNAVLDLLRDAFGDEVGDNQPYALEDDKDNTVPLHAKPRGLDYLELEIRQDLIFDEEGQARVAGFLAGVLTEALKRL